MFRIGRSFDTPSIWKTAAGAFNPDGSKSRTRQSRVHASVISFRDIKLLVFISL